MKKHDYFWDTESKTIVIQQEGIDIVELDNDDLDAIFQCLLNHGVLVIYDRRTGTSYGSEDANIFPYMDGLELILDVKHFKKTHLQICAERAKKLLKERIDNKCAGEASNATASPALPAHLYEQLILEE